MKKKLLKSASLVALSAVMMCGAAVSFAGCGDDAYTISISMFCGDSDVDVNRQNVADWANYYTNVLREKGIFTEEEEVKTKFTYQSDTDAYFTQLSNLIASNSQPDVFYVSPKYVKVWSRLGKILDMSSALQEYADDLSQIWEDSLAFYSYANDPNYNSGDRIYYDESTQTFKTIANDVKVGIYGLPKDYSNFGLGYNEVLISDQVKADMMSKTTNDRTGVKGAENTGATLTYNRESGVVTSDPYGDEDVPLINIGKPTWYRPYNFYAFSSYEAALAGGDPMAVAVQYYTGGKGYCVTIPGWPGDTFEDAKAYWSGTPDVTIPAQDKDGNALDTGAAYDVKQGYITYTYAEYSALTWALTYYLNTYNWQGNGKGGAMTKTGVKNVYGNDSYDGVLYLLPWLAGNNAQYLNKDSTAAVSEAGNNTYTQSKATLYGEQEQTINWGINNDEFLEVIGAFYAYGSDWNGNSNNAGDTKSDKPSGWDMFCAGYCVFYGVGTWNAGALNATDRQFLKYRLMPEPVSEDYALASLVKNQDYEMVGYGDLAGKVEFTQGGGGTDPVCEVDVTDLPESYSGQEIVDNQIERQDKWGARMDSVGYGVSGLITNGADWREGAAIDLVRYLTIDRNTQVTLTYAGSQLPNFRDQCQDFNGHKGDFEDMVTPEDEAWDETYAAAKAMFEAASGGGTVGQWIANYQGGAFADKYDKQFQNTNMSTLLDLSYAMKTLKMVAYTQADRDLSLRMQYGLNATRDSAMYTYNDDWLGVLDARGKGYVMAYAQQNAYSGEKGNSMADILDKMLYKKDAAKTPIQGTSYGTPAWFYAFSEADVKAQLAAAIAAEQRLLGNS